MPTPSSTRIDFGNALAAPGVQQPTGTISIDAFGLAQSQLTFAVDSGAQLDTALMFYSAGADYPTGLTYPMVSYKTSVSLQKGGVAMFTVDYMGVWRASGHTDAQITGVVNTTAQPIETHPNFTAVTDSTIGTGSPTQLLAGTWDAIAPGNGAIFNTVNNADGTVAHTFGGFAVSDDAAAPNIKAGIRQFLRPMWTVRGVMFFSPSLASTAVAKMTNGIGRTLNNATDMQTLITPGDILGALSPDLCLLTAANAECIGNPDGYAAIKVTYDIMIGGELGWDQDIYGKMEDAIF